MSNKERKNAASDFSFVPAQEASPKSNLVSLSSLPVEAFADSQRTYDSPLGFTVRARIPMFQLIDLISEGIAITIGDRGAIPYPIVTLAKRLLIIKYFTDLDLRILDKRPLIDASLFDLYDDLCPTIYNEVIANIDKDLLGFIEEHFEKSIRALADYRNSALALVEHINASQTVNFEDFTKNLDILNDPEKTAKLQEFMKIAANP